MYSTRVYFAREQRITTIEINRNWIEEWIDSWRYNIHNRKTLGKNAKKMRCLEKVCEVDLKIVQFWSLGYVVKGNSKG